MCGLRHKLPEGHSKSTAKAAKRAERAIYNILQTRLAIEEGRVVLTPNIELYLPFL
ncbi:MAG: hypothetical protein V3W09_04995 [Nitrososphaerales archaeon]